MQILASQLASFPFPPVAITDSTYLRQRNIRNNDRIQRTWGILRRRTLIPPRMVLILGLLVLIVGALVLVVDLPWHRAFSHGDSGFGRCGCGFAAEVVTGETEGAGHDA